MVLEESDKDIIQDQCSPPGGPVGETAGPPAAERIIIVCCDVDWVAGQEGSLGFAKTKPGNSQIQAG